LFWRWPVAYQEATRDGVKPWLKDVVTQWRAPQREGKDPSLSEGIAKKLKKARERGYIGKGYVNSLMSFFAVPKGDSEIRMVYNGTKSGLNNTLWAPWFALPTVE